jgi:YidC/Oxa1 family membrane protein insertase
MDKNTLYGLLLMGLVIFGFSYLNQGKQEKLQQQLQEQAEQQQAEAEAEAARALVIDSITPAEAAAAPAIMQLVGSASTDSLSNVVNYNSNKVALTYNGTTVSGTVNAIDTTLTYEAVVNSNFGNDLSLDNRKAAIENLRNALAEANRYRGFARHLSGKEQLVTLKNNVLSLDINTHGGNIAAATLLKYFNYLPKPGTTNDIDTTQVNVWKLNNASYNFILTSATQRFDTSEFYFNPEQVNDSTVVMKLDLGHGASWALRYTLPDDSYVVKMDIVQNGMESVIPSSVATVELDWNQRMGRNERGRTFEERNSGLYYQYVGDTPDNLSAQGDHNKELNQRLDWIAFKNQFFSSVMIPRNDFIAADVESKDLKDDLFYVKQLSAKATMDYSSTAENPISIDIFFGPNLYPLLSSLDKQIDHEDGAKLNLTRLVPLGWSLFRWISTLIIIPLFTFLGKFISSYGIIILLLTVFIKIVLFPLTYKSLKSQAVMRVLAPEIKEINEKYPGQEQAMTRNQKTMELYSRAGASPFSGCLPMLLQMPILIAMFWFFPSCIELRGQSFLWASNLAAPDVIFTLPFTIPWYGNHVSLFCLLMTATNIIYTRINMQNQPSTSSTPGMKWMMYLMPVMFLFIFNDYAAGLSYYYFLSLLITIAQTYIFRLCVNEDKVRAQLKAAAAKPRKKSGFMARLEEAQRQQQAMMREQQKRNNNSKGRR